MFTECYSSIKICSICNGIKPNLKESKSFMQFTSTYSVVTLGRL